MLFRIQNHQTILISKQIIEAHDGEITVTSEEGVLTEFKIKLGI